jgi:hypothetical protein
MNDDDQQPRIGIGTSAEQVPVDEAARALLDGYGEPSNADDPTARAHEPNGSPNGSDATDDGETWEEIVVALCKTWSAIVAKGFPELEISDAETRALSDLWSPILRDAVGLDVPREYVAAASTALIFLPKIVALQRRRCRTRTHTVEHPIEQPGYRPKIDDHGNPIE